MTTNRPRHCVFCGRTGRLSREHFWSEWLHPHLPTEPLQQSHDEHQFVYERDVLVAEPRKVTRQGGTRTKTMRVVCSQCNNGWMSRMETAAKPIVIPVMSGNEAALDERARRELARWIALKVLVADANSRDDAVCTPGERRAFMSRDSMPDHLSIWIGRTAGRAWHSTFQRHASTLSRGTSNLPPPGKKNVHSMTFGIGQLLVLALLDRARIGIGIKPESSDRLPRLWPLQLADIQWPPARTLSDVEAHWVANALNRFQRQPGVRWMPHRAAPSMESVRI